MELLQAIEYFVGLIPKRIFEEAYKTQQEYIFQLCIE